LEKSKLLFVVLVRYVSFYLANKTLTKPYKKTCNRSISWNYITELYYNMESIMGIYIIKWRYFRTLNITSLLPKFFERGRQGVKGRREIGVE
jgi:hypothetical protein